MDETSRIGLLIAASTLCAALIAYFAFSDGRPIPDWPANCAKARYDFDANRRVCAEHREKS